MKPWEEYQQLVDAGLIVPSKGGPSRLKYPTMLVPVPNVTTGGIIDQNNLDRVRILDAQLERYPK